MANMMHAATAVEARGPGQVETSVTRLGDALDQLEREVNNLVGSLICASRAEPPTPTQAGAKVGEVLVPLASNITGYTERVYALIAGVSGARDRLEL